jgi:hypothetical protein|nr:DUF2235 domain-containing protein [uncultured Pseudogulbenkiania sp.]
MSEVVKRLNEAERVRLDSQVEAVARSPAPQVGARTGQQFVFVAHFDGTNNDKDDLKLSGNPLPTNVAELWSQMKPLEADNFKTQYYRGVGTDPGAEGLADALMPSAEMRATASRAYKDFEDEATDWLRAHPEANPTESLKVMATGFSRGGGTAAIFSQLLYERGLTDPQTGKTLIPPGQLGLAGAMIYDPVTTGYDGNSSFSPTSENITVVQAQNEYRTLFKGVHHSTHPDVTVVPVTGNHCNIGGGYDRGIGARVLEASNDWFQKSGVPIQEMPRDKRHDGSATVYHERDLPYSDKVANAGRHSLARSAFPVGSRVLEGAAGRADYPVTHDPREGLHAPRELDPVAHGERERADGWRRFNGAEGAVWRKDYVSDKGVPLSAVIVERDLPGKTSDRVDIYLSRRDWPGELLYEKRLPADAGQQLRESLDKRLDSVAKKPAEAGRPQPSTRQSEHAERFMEQLAPRLGQLGMNQRQIHTLAAAAAKEASRYENQGPVGQFIFGRDGNTIALRQEYPPLREFSVAQALSQSPAEHWREAVAMNTAMRDAAFVSPTPSPQARPEAAIARG